MLLEDNGAAAEYSSIEDDGIAAEEKGFRSLSTSKYSVDPDSVEFRGGPLSGSGSDVVCMTRKCLSAKGRKE